MPWIRRVSRRVLTAEPRDRSNVGSRGTCGEKKLTLEQVPVRLLRFSPLSIIPPLLHTLLFIYHRRPVLIAIDSVVN